MTEPTTMPLTPSNTAHRPTHQASLHSGPGNLRRLSRQPSIVRIFEGCAWLTVDGRDLILLSGEEVHLPASAYPPLVSALGERTLVYAQEIVPEA